MTLGTVCRARRTLLCRLGRLGRLGCLGCLGRQAAVEGLHEDRLVGERPDLDVSPSRLSISSSPRCVRHILCQIRRVAIGHPDISPFARPGQVVCRQVGRQDHGNPFMCTRQKGARHARCIGKMQCNGPRPGFAQTCGHTQCLRDKIGAHPLGLHPHAVRLHQGIEQQSLQRAPHVRERPSLSGFRNRKTECRRHGNGITHHENHRGA